MALRRGSLHPLPSVPSYQPRLLLLLTVNTCSAKRNDVIGDLELVVVATTARTSASHALRRFVPHLPIEPPRTGLPSDFRPQRSEGPPNND